MNIPKQLRFKDHHPTMVKFDKLCQLADELGLVISFYGQRTVIADRDNKTETTVYLEDIESEECVGEIPPSLEFKMVRENPAYLAEEKRKHEDYLKVRAEEEKKREEAKLAREKALAEKQAKEEEEKERKLLAKLKKKYNE